jgi:hypothetical protein
MQKEKVKMSLGPFSNFTFDLLPFLSLGIGIKGSLKEHLQIRNHQSAIDNFIVGAAGIPACPFRSCLAGREPATLRACPPLWAM